MEALGQPDGDHVHTLTCCTHIFVHIARAQAQTQSFHCQRCTFTHGSRVPKRFFAHVSHLSISPSPVSCLTHPCCSLTVTWRPFLTFWRPQVLAVLTCPQSAGRAHLRTSAVEFGYLAKSTLDTGYEPKKFDKITSVDNDTIQNKGQFGVLTVFESSVSHVSHDDFALQLESNWIWRTIFIKKAMREVAEKLNAIRQEILKNNKDWKELVRNMVRNHEQWVYSSTILTYWAVTSDQRSSSSSYYTEFKNTREYECSWKRFWSSTC